MNLQEQKRRFRKQAILVRNQLSKEKRNLYSEQIWNQLYAMECYQKADAIYLYLSYQSETDTMSQIDRLLKSCKQIAVPKVTGRHEMTFYYIHSINDLRPGFHGIFEPITNEIADGTEGLLLIPGTAFSSQCHRMGYGGGFYDTYIHAHPKLTTIGMAFDCQIYDEIPVETCDATLSMVVTECRVLTTSAQE